MSAHCFQSLANRSHGRLAGRFFMAMAFLSSLIAGNASAQSGCPGGAGGAITITNFKAKETLGHDLALVKGTVPAGTQVVTLTTSQEGAFAVGVSGDWPVGNAIFKAFVRLKPGLNHVVVSAPGAQNACLELTYAPNAYNRQVRLILAVPKDLNAGDAVIKTYPGEPGTLESVKKRIAFAALMQQSLFAELMHKAGMDRRVPYFKRETLGDPEVLVWNTGSTKADTNVDVRVKFASLEEKIEALQDGRTRYMIFFSHTKMSGALMSSYSTMYPTDNAMFSWPQNPSEIISRYNDRRKPYEVAFPGKENIANTFESLLKFDFSFWFKISAIWTLGVPDPKETLPNSPFGHKCQNLYTLFMSREPLGEYVASEMALDPPTATALIANPQLNESSINQSPAVTSSKPVVQGIGYNYYEGPFDTLTNFSVFAPVASGSTGDFSLASRKVEKNYAFVFEGYLRILDPGPYLFQMVSNGGGRLTIDGRVAFTKGLNEDQSAGGIPLDFGLHRIQVHYLSDTGTAAMTLNWSSLGNELKPIPVSALQREDQSTHTRGVAAAIPGMRLVPGMVLMQLVESEHLSLRMVSPRGSSLGTLFEGVLPAGQYRIPIPKRAGHGFVIAERQGHAGRSVSTLPLKDR